MNRPFERRGSRDKRTSRGSALLIVLVFAAIIAITLYTELPVFVFEAHRQKEQLLMDRGNEYKHAIRLFVRHFGTYPASLDALENMNTVRCLRRRYVDPFTGKDNWRLLHAGPGGILLDSKVTPNPNGQSSTASVFASGSDSSQEEESAGPTIVNRVPSRPPAVSATGGDVTQMASAALTQQDPSAPLLAAGEAAQLTNNSPDAVAAQGQTDAGTGASAPPGPPGAGASFGGGIAGVASRAQGHSIKVMAGQSDYSFWEFYYDPTKDLLLGFANLMNTSTGGVNVNGTGAPGTVATPPTAPTSTTTTPPSP